MTNSLISGITSMPSHLDADDSMDGLDEDLDFRGAAISYTPDDISTSDSDSDHQMRFQSTHFNGSGSSSDSSKPNLMQSAGSILTSGRQIISDALAKASSSHPRLPARTGGTDSDGSEFEIIDEGDLEKP